MRWRLASLLVVALLIAGCTGSGPTERRMPQNGSGNGTGAPEQAAGEDETGFTPVGNMTLESPVFSSGGPIPEKYTCDGIDHHPQFNFVNLPDEAASIAMIVDDPDAPKGVFTHWVVWNIPAVSVITAGADVGTAGRNDFGNTAYNGPCPPEGEEHTYRFRAYALDTELNLSANASRSTLEQAMNGHVLAADQTTATYKR